MRTGRQEIAIGRFVSIREATNLRRTFDGLRIDGSFDTGSLALVVAPSTRQKPDSFDNDPNPGDELAAAVWTERLPGAPHFSLDFALLEHDNDRAVYQAGTGRERRRTVGVRLSGTRGRWDIDTQASYQFGNLATTAEDLDISSWGAAFEGGLTFAKWRTAPRFAIRIDWAEGDRDTTDGRLATFDLPYPNLAYLSDAAFFAPRNLRDIQPFASATLTRKLTMTFGTQFLWRVTRQDAVYSSANLPLVRAGVEGSYVATQPYLRVAYRATRLVTLQSSIERAHIGDVLRNAGGRDQTFASFQVGVSF
jgi:hypothetical protein